MYTPFIELYLLEETKALRKAVLISEAHRDDASVDPSFYRLREHESFRKLVNQEDEDAPDS